jgi:hypothetical protein
MEEGVICVRPLDRVLFQRRLERLLRVFTHGMAPPIRAGALARKGGAGVLVVVAERHLCGVAGLELEALRNAYAQQSLRLL